MKRLRGLRANASTRSHAELDAATDLAAGDRSRSGSSIARCGHAFRTSPSSAGAAAPITGTLRRSASRVQRRSARWPKSRNLVGAARGPPMTHCARCQTLVGPARSIPTSRWAVTDARARATVSRPQSAKRREGADLAAGLQDRTPLRRAITLTAIKWQPPYRTASLSSGPCVHGARRSRLR